MMQQVVGFTLFFLLMTHSTVESSDSLFRSDDFFLASDGELPDDTTNLFTENDGGELLAFDGTLASAQGDCTSNGDNGNLFLSSGAARLRPRIDACLPSLPPVPNIYDSDAILNQFKPETQSKPGITIPGTQTQNEKDILRLNELFDLPEFTHDTNPTEQDDVCPEELVGDSRIPVCESKDRSRDTLRRKREDHYTLYNIRHFMSPKEAVDLFAPDLFVKLIDVIALL